MPLFTKTASEVRLLMDHYQITKISRQILRRRGDSGTHGDKRNINVSILFECSIFPKEQKVKTEISLQNQKGLAIPFSRPLAAVGVGCVYPALIGIDTRTVLIA